MSTLLSDALNDKNNVSKTIKAGGAVPIEYTDPVWEDETFPFTQAKQGATDVPDFDYTNIGLLFDKSKASEKIFMICQFKHKRKLGAVVRPHLHWRQTAAVAPVWKIDYKWVINGEAVPESFTEGVAQAEEAFEWTSGSLAQISKWAELTPPATDNVSTMLLIKLYRDDNLAGAAATELAWEFDIHYQIDSPGSQDEYTK